MCDFSKSDSLCRKKWKKDVYKYLFPTWCWRGWSMTIVVISIQQSVWLLRGCVPAPDLRNPHSSQLFTSKHISLFTKNVNTYFICLYLENFHYFLSSLLHVNFVRVAFTQFSSVLTPSPCSARNEISQTQARVVHGSNVDARFWKACLVVMVWRTASRLDLTLLPPHQTFFYIIYLFRTLPSRSSPLCQPLFPLYFIAKGATFTFF